MKHISLFSGIGGFDLAAQWMKWENVAHCELNPFGQRILKYYWPNAISYEDITKTDLTIHRGNIDILTGGFPCQPYSAAGKRKGKEDNRHLWPEMLRAIREIQPSWIVGENVRGLTNWNGGLVFDEVQADLENEGYEVLPFLLPACAVNAPHRRDRIWFVAYSNSLSKRSPGESGETQSNRCQNNDESFGGGTTAKQHNGWSDVLRTATNTSCNGSNGRSATGNWQKENETIGADLQFETSGLSVQQSFTYSNGPKSQRIREEGNAREEEKDREEWERINFRPNIQPDWEEFPTQSPLCTGDDGLSSKLDRITFPKFRKESIKGGGNAIVPQVAFQIFKAIDKYEKLNAPSR